MRRMRLLILVIGCATLVQADRPTLIRSIRNAARASNQGYAEAKVQSGFVWKLEDQDKALPMAASGIPYSDEVLPPARTLIALYRANLSHRWDEAAKMIPKARYFLVSVYRIRPGAQSGFADLVKMRTSRFESINFDQPEIAYQIMSGMPSGTFLFITPLASLTTSDDGLAKTPDGLREIAAAQKLAA